MTPQTQSDLVNLQEDDHVEQSARSIVEVMLKRTSDAILADDFEAMNGCFAFPLLLESMQSKMVIRTTKEHRKLFVSLIEGYRSKNVTEIIRVCEVAEFVSPEMIRSLHISHIMSGNTRVDDPMPTLATIERIDGDWRITASQYAATKNVPIGRAMDLHARTDDPD